MPTNPEETRRIKEPRMVLGSNSDLNAPSSWIIHADGVVRDTVDGNQEPYSYRDVGYSVKTIRTRRKAQPSLPWYKALSVGSLVLIISATALIIGSLYVLIPRLAAGEYAYIPYYGVANPGSLIMLVGTFFGGILLLVLSLVYIRSKRE